MLKLTLFSVCCRWRLAEGPNQQRKLTVRDVSVSNRQLLPRPATFPPHKPASVWNRMCSGPRPRCLASFPLPRHHPDGSVELSLENTQNHRGRSRLDAERKYHEPPPTSPSAPSPSPAAAAPSRHVTAHVETVSHKAADNDFRDYNSHWQLALCCLYSLHVLLLLCASGLMLFLVLLRNCNSNF